MPPPDAIPGVRELSMHLSRLSLLLGAAALAAWFARPLAAQTPPASQPASVSSAEETPEQTAAQYLGQRFTSRAGGISLRPPLRATEIKPALAGANIVQFVNNDEKWSLRVTHLVLERPQPLTSVDNPATPNVDESKTNPGVLNQIVGQITGQNAGSRILRNDVINVGPHDAGLLIARYAQATQMYLRQMAVIQRDQRDYYVLDLTTPSTRAAADPDSVEDPGEAMAVKIFRAILDSVQLLDMRLIEADRDQRLYQARAMLVNLSKRIKEAALAEQYFRIQRDGKDIGWSYTTEEFSQRQGESGLYSALVSQVTPEAGVKTSTASEMFCADSRRSEAWVTITTTEKDGKRAQSSEFGQADQHIQRKELKGQGTDATDKHNPLMSEIRWQRLLVTQTTPSGVTSTQRDLPPFYIQQALSAMLPRLLPLSEPKGYLFSVWLGSERELVYRFLDVEPRRTVNFAGRKVMVIPVEDRIGLDGEPTYHYFTPEGKYLGSASPGGISVIAVDQQTLTNLYPNATMARPHVLDMPTDR